MIAKIAISGVIYAIDKPYSYRVPECMQVKPGIRVVVPFGRGNAKKEGMVLAVEAGTDLNLKPVERVLDDEPVLDGAMLRLAAFVRERYFCTFYDALHAILPAGLWYASRDAYTISEPDWRAQVTRKPEAIPVMEAVEALGGRADYEALKKQFPEETELRKQIHYLLGKRLLTAETDLLRKVGDKTEQTAALAVSVEEALEFAARKRKAAPLQAALLELLATVGSGCTKELCYFTGASPATLRRLATLGLVELSSQPLLRRPEIRVDGPAEPILLNGEQQRAYDGLLERMQREQPGTALLYGVTGSGKTAVYIRLIEACLERGKTALLLVPEIALTPQLLGRMAAHFGDGVAVLHSGLRVGERYDEWKRIRAGDAKVVIGTRSAVFAPLREPGLLIVDEEQEHTYKSENAPRYHAREVAIYRGAKAGALVVLGSATPSVESMYRARSGIYGLYTISSRYNGQTLPQVTISDMKEELRAGRDSTIGAELQSALEETMDSGKQSILFLNRRGASRLTVCVECGYVPDCPRCSVHLTYHSANRRLMCHYCGYSQPEPERCPMCGGHLKQTGAGTQRVEQELTARFPGMAVQRMDADTVSAANPHEKILRQFREKKIPVLLGTQMVAKGLDFPNVTLVGVLDADMSLYVDNFRAAETTFSMITQVVGRAGRGAAEGRAVIQTMTPENAVIRLAAAQDYDSFYELEIGLRELRRCPPFADLIVIQFLGPTEGGVLSGAMGFREMLIRQLEQGAYGGEQVSVLGPAPAPVAKVNNSYRYRLTLACRNTRTLRELLAHLLRAFLKDRKNRGVTAFADVNPYD